MDRKQQPKPKRIACLALLTLVISACAAASKKDAASAGSAPPQEPASPSTQQPGYPSQDLSPAKKEPPPPAPPPAPSASGPTPIAPSTNATGDFAKPPPNRAAAMSQASSEIESSQRELDVAGGDCRNACRALGSMDRAAGRLCGLAQSTDEVKKCDTAKTKVLSARDKVRNTCGTCPDVSVDRNAPVPSR